MNLTSCIRPLALAAALVLTLVAPLTSCDKDVVLKTLSVNLTTSLELDVPSDSLSAVWTQELDPNSNPDVRDNRSKIKQVTVESVSYRVGDFSGPIPTLGSGTMKFYLNDAPTEVFTLATITDLDLPALHLAGTTQDLPLTEAAKAKLVDAINRNQHVTFVFEGAVRNPSYTRFDLQIASKIDVGV